MRFTPWRSSHSRRADRPRLLVLAARPQAYTSAPPCALPRRYYNSWHQCKYDYSDEEPQCAKLKGWAMSMCPYEWVEKWETQSAEGRYPGPVPGEKEASGGH